MNKYSFERLTLERVQELLESQGFAIGLVDPDEYHKWKKVLPNCVSKSNLMDFAENPLRYKMNLDAGIEKESAGFKLGSAVDSALLTPDLFAKKYFYEPKEVQICADGKPHARGHQSSDQKKRWDDRAAKGDVFLKLEELKQVNDMAGNLAEHMGRLGLRVAASPDGSAENGGVTCLTQVAMWLQVDAVRGETLPVTLTVCGMLDALPLEDPVLLDVKTTSKGLGEAALNYAMTDYHYGDQAALYTDLFQICTGEPEARRFAFLFVESVYPYQTRMVWVPVLLMEAYRRHYQDALIEYARALHTGEWGKLQLPDMDFTPPRYELNKLGAAMLED